MSESPDPDELARALRIGMGQVVRRLRTLKLEGDLSLPETAALARLDRDGPATGSELARQEQISPQSMGATLADLETRGLIHRTGDPSDGRRVVFSITTKGRAALVSRRNASADAIAKAFGAHFTPDELRTLHLATPLIERLGDAL